MYRVSPGGSYKNRAPFREIRQVGVRRRESMKIASLAPFPKSNSIGPRILPPAKAPRQTNRPLSQKDEGCVSVCRLCRALGGGQSAKDCLPDCRRPLGARNVRPPDLPSQAVEALLLSDSHRSCSTRHESQGHGCG